MNVLATLSLDTVAYQFAVLDDAMKQQEAARLLRIVDDLALPMQLEVWGLVRNTDLRHQYGFDTLYDLARLYALRATLTAIAAPGRQNEDLELVIGYLREARQVATVRQADSARRSLAGEPVFRWLPEHARNRMAVVLDGRE